MLTDYPNITGYFQAADIVNQVLNFGLPAAIDVQISGNDLNSDYRIASRLQAMMLNIPGVVDSRIAEPLDYPAFKIGVDRNKALELGITMQQVASGLLSSLSGNSLISPNYWLDPVNGVNYNVVTQAPIATTQSVAQIANISAHQRHYGIAWRGRLEWFYAAVGPVSWQCCNYKACQRSCRHRPLHGAACDGR